MTVRIASVQWGLGPIAGADSFEQKLDYFIRAAAGFGAGFVVFPELFTCQLLSAFPKRLSLSEGVDALTDYTPRFTETLRRLAATHSITIIGGSHLSRTAEGVRNTCHIVTADGRILSQDKVHATPGERSAWGVTGGGDVEVFDTPAGKAAVLICYDVEFPELVRRAVDRGAQLLFIPFCTDDRQGYYRVRHCAQARAIENQCYLALSGVVGNQPNVENMDVNWGRSCVLTPCDLGFPPDGVAVEAPENVETMVVAELDMAKLKWAREQGTVRNLADRRTDLYGPGWKA